MSTRKCGNITHLLNNSHSDVASKIPDSWINLADRPSWPTALLFSNCLTYFIIVPSDMCLKLNSIVGEQFSRMSFTLSCEACFSMASWNANSSTPSGSPSKSPIEMKYLLNTSATSCGRERIQSSSLRIILFPHPLELLLERNGFIYFFKFSYSHSAYRISVENRF